MTLTDDVALARAVARGRGVAEDADINWEAMGAACREAIRRKLPPPDESRFMLTPVAVVPEPPERPPPSPDRRVVDSSPRMDPRNAREVMELRRMRIITRAEARLYLGLPVRWWRWWR